MLLPEITLYKHQLETLEFLQKTPGALVASTVGTGKSAVAIAVATDYPKATVVCPSYLARNWQREFLKFSGKAATIFPEISNYTICSVDSIYKDALPFIGRDVIILDESHYIGNSSSRRTKTFVGYVETYKPKRLLLLSGTPMRNRVPELYPTMYLLDLYHRKGFIQRYKNQYAYNNHFTHAVRKKFGPRTITAYEGAQNMTELKKYLEGEYVRYTLDELGDMPELVEEEILLDLKKDKEVEEGLCSALEALLKSEPEPTSIAGIKRKSAENKVEAAIELLRGMIEQGDGPVVVFSDHVKPVMQIAEALGGRYITGAVSTNARDKIIQDFQEGKFPLLAGTLGSMSTGLNITVSNVAVMVDLSYIPTVNTQAIGRIHRIGQKRKCRVVNLVAPGIDEKIARLLKQKMKLISEVIK